MVDRWPSGKPKRKKPEPKLPLDDAIQQFCKVQITTSKPEEDFEDVTLTIEFMNGRLKGQIYQLNIDRTDYREVW